MRLEVQNTRTGAATAVEPPPLLNPVRVGRDRRNDVVLDDPDVPDQAFAVGNDLTGTGWVLWRMVDRPVTVAGVPLAQRGVQLTQRRVAVECGPFVVTIYFTPEEWDGRPNTDQLERQAAALVQQVHREVLDRRPVDPGALDRAPQNADVFELETAVQELAKARTDFAADGTRASDLAAHMVGGLVRSDVVGRLGGAARRVADWARPRLTQAEPDKARARLADEAHAALELGGAKALTDQVAAIERGYWGWWRREGGRLTPDELLYLAVRRLTDEVKNLWYGFGPLEDLLADPTVNEIMVVGPDTIFVERRGRTELSGRRFFTDPTAIIQRVLARAGREINTGRPFADGRLPDGSRVHAIIPPVSLSGPCLTVRRFPAEPLVMADLIRRGSLTAAARDLLVAAVRGRRNVLISGGTGTGKSTLLNILAAFIPGGERIITVEDTAELQVRTGHVASLEARPPNSEGLGAVTVRDLVWNALRMRPNRLIVGECRGGEALDMLQAMNTGHAGSMTTVHANSPPDAVERLVVLTQMAADSNLPVAAIRRQIASAVNLIVQLEEVDEAEPVGGMRRKRRRVSKVAEVVGYDAAADRVALRPLFDTVEGTLAATGALPTFLPALVAEGLVPDPVAFVRGPGAG